MKKLYYEPASSVQMINHCYGEGALAALREYFGDFPITINPDDLRVLRAISSACSERPLREIIHAVEQHGAIRIWWDDKERIQREHLLRNGTTTHD